METTDKTDRTQVRKDEHLDLVLAGAGVAAGTTGLEQVHFIHNALPEVDYAEIALGVDFLGKRLRAPLMISSMTGGPQRAAAINRNLAEAAEDLGIAFAVGSQRVSLEGGHAQGLGRELRTLAPTVPILANIGGAQLAKGWGVTEARRAIDAIAADALIVHLNPLQEALQPEGDRNWRGVIAGISSLVRSLGTPVIVKETGCGLSGAVTRILFDIGVTGVDVAGSGGTNWGLIEGARGTEHGRRVASAFAGWGVPTAQAIREARSASPNGLVIASGGIRDGLDVARAIHLGANLVGQAAAILPMALTSSQAVVDHFHIIADQLRAVCLCTGASTVGELRGKAEIR